MHNRQHLPGQKVNRGFVLVFEYRTGKSPKQKNKNLPGIVPSKRHHAIFLHPKERRKKKKKPNESKHHIQWLFKCFIAHLRWLIEFPPQVWGALFPFSGDDLRPTR